VAEGEGALIERVQRQRTWALIGGPGRQGVRARSGILGSGPFDQDRMEGGVRGSPRRSEGVRGGPKGSEPFDQDRMGGNQTGETNVREAVPTVRVVPSESNGGDQTEETDGCGRRRSSPRR
jgi:hypothetical protein